MPNIPDSVHVRCIADVRGLARDKSRNGRIIRDMNPPPAMAEVLALRGDSVRTPNPADIVPRFSPASLFNMNNG